MTAQTTGGERGERPALLDVVLVAPQIATNTGNIIRLCANVGARLHLVEPLGFSLDAAAVRRGGLDYHELVDVRLWRSWPDVRAGLAAQPPQRWFATTATVGRATVGRRPDEVHASQYYDACTYRAGDVVVFGCEASGLPAEILAEFGPDRCLTIPMRPGNRSLNVANAVAVVVYEAWRQHGFAGTAPGGGEPRGAGSFSESPQTDSTG
jgi:tRNA (cytidine/uridine-2'-O-)-methyltransferase